MATTPYMSLSLPTVGSTAGPAWATQVNAAFTAIDSHDHSPGKGVQVRSSGLYVDSGLSLGGFDASEMRSARFTNHNAPIGESADLGCLFVSGGELYYRDGSGNTIQLSSGGALNAASLGAIGGDYATGTASEFYTSASNLFSFESSAGVKAHIAAGNLSVYEAVSGGKAVTLRAPTGLAANYPLIFPAALPASTRLLSLDSSGNIAATAYAASAVARGDEARTWTAKQTFGAGADVTGDVAVTGDLDVSGDLEAAGATITAGNLALTAVGEQQIVKTNGALKIAAVGASEILFFTNGVHAAAFQTDGDLWMGNHKVAYLAAPTESDDAATKGYVDGVIQPRAWARVLAGAGGTVTIVAAQGIYDGSYTGSNMTLDLYPAAPDANYACVVSGGPVGAGAAIVAMNPATSTVNSVVISQSNHDGALNYLSGYVYSLAIFW